VRVGNLYSLPDRLPDKEIADDLVPGRSVRVERIISSGQSTPPGDWYDQDADEWVALLQGQAVLTYSDGRTVTLGAGDHLIIPAHVRHRVEQTSGDPPCIWLAVHGELT